MGGAISRGAAVFAALVATLTLLLFVRLWRTTVTRDPIDLRIQQYGGDVEPPRGRSGKRSRGRSRSGVAAGGSLARKLAQADIPVTPSEYRLMTMGGMAAGLVLGALVWSLLVGLGLALVVAVGSSIYLSSRCKRRMRQINDQLPDVLTLMVSGLRAGQGMNQAMRLLVDQMPPPASVEFARVINAIELGQPMTDALEAMSDRIGSDDLDMMVTAINVQRETGGNLAETLDTISGTIRDRIRLQGEIRTLTAQQRLSGNILALLPTGLAVVVGMLSPNFYAPFLEPGPYRILPIGALIMQGIGYFLIQRIVDIDI